MCWHISLKEMNKIPVNPNFPSLPAGFGRQLAESIGEVLYDMEDLGQTMTMPREKRSPSVPRRWVLGIIPGGPVVDDWLIWGFGRFKSVNRISRLRLKF
jgi:hypothetical protein